MSSLATSNSANSSNRPKARSLRPRNYPSSRQYHLKCLRLRKSGISLLLWPIRLFCWSSRFTCSVCTRQETFLSLKLLTLWEYQHSISPWHLFLLFWCTLCRMTSVGVATHTLKFSTFTWSRLWCTLRSLGSPQPSVFNHSPPNVYSLFCFNSPIISAFQFQQSTQWLHVVW